MKLKPKPEEESIIDTVLRNIELEHKCRECGQSLVSLQAYYGGIGYVTEWVCTGKCIQPGKINDADSI